MSSCDRRCLPDGVGVCERVWSKYWHPIGKLINHQEFGFVLLGTLRDNSVTSQIPCPGLHLHPFDIKKSAVMGSLFDRGTYQGNVHTLRCFGLLFVLSLAHDLVPRALFPLRPAAWEPRVQGRLKNILRPGPRDHLCRGHRAKAVSTRSTMYCRRSHARAQCLVTRPSTGPRDNDDGDGEADYCELEP